MWWVDYKARARLDAFEERLMKVERAMHALEMDWADTLDKVKRMMQRVAKRAEVAERAEAAEGVQPEDVLARQESSAGLSPRLAAINAKILARRNRGGGTTQ